MDIIIICIVRIEDEYVDRMYDSQLNEMMKDLCKLLHDLEWWKSCDYSEDTYRRTVTEFKRSGLNKLRLMYKKQIESKFEQTKDELLKEFEYLKGDE